MWGVAAALAGEAQRGEPRRAARRREDRCLAHMRHQVTNCFTPRWTRLVHRLTRIALPTTERLVQITLRNQTSAFFTTPRLHVMREGGGHERGRDVTREVMRAPREVTRKSCGIEFMREGGHEGGRSLYNEDDGGREGDHEGGSRREGSHEKEVTREVMREGAVLVPRSHRSLIQQNMV